MSTIRKYTTEKGSKFPLAISIPADVSIKDAIIVCHGLGLTGGGNTENMLDWVLTQENELPFEVLKTQSERFILVIPKLTGGSWTANNFELVQYAYDTLMRDFKPTRVFIAGFSLGGQAAAGYPASSAARKTAISGSLTISGVNPGGNLASLKDWPLFIAHDRNDPTVTLDKAEAVRIAASVPASRVDYFTGYGHGKVPEYVAGNKKYWDWLAGTPAADPVVTPPAPVVKTIKSVTTTVFYTDGTQEIKTW